MHFNGIRCARVPGLRSLSRRILTLFLCGLFALSALMLAPAPSYAAETQKVRVAYVIDGNYQTGEEGMPKSGYGYEYLQKIAAYTGWEYEYVYGRFSELLNGVETGAIDLMGNISKTDARIGRYDFGQNPQGSEAYLLVTQGDDSRVDTADFSSLSGKRISVSKGSIQEGYLAKWLEEHAVTDVELVYYDSSLERETAFDNGEIDAIVTTQLSGRIPDKHNWAYIDRIGSSDYYFVTNKHKPWLKQELDAAQKRILDINANYNTTLNIKYFNDTTAGRKELSTWEIQWLRDAAVIRVGYLDVMRPYCFLDEETGEMTGMYRDFLDKATELYGMQFLFTAYHSFDAMLRDVRDGKLELALPMYYDYWCAESYGVSLVDEIVASNMYALTRHNELPKYQRIAVNASFPGQDSFFTQQFPDAEQIVYDSLDRCMQAVYDGKVDCTVVNSDIVIGQSRSYPLLQKLDAVDMRTPVRFSIGVRRDQVELLAIMNRLVSITSEGDISDGMVIYSSDNDGYTFEEIYDAFTMEILIGLVVFFGLVIGTILIYFKRSLKQKSELEALLAAFKQADHDRRRDFLTSLQNRQDLFDMLKEVVSGSHSPVRAMYMMDIDDFKSYNDQKGHSAGDECLRTIGNALVAYGERNGLCFYRYGGEEMLGLNFNATKSADEIATELVELVRSLKIPHETKPSGFVTVSLGYTANNSRYEKMIDYADKAMYRAKRTGKDKAVCYDYMEDTCVCKL